MKRILVTNDDGVFSPGLAALTNVLSRFGEVTVVAPAREVSAIGHALTLHNPIRFEPVGERIFALDGTPTDCVNIGISVILEGLPDLIVSGINKGLNVGDDVTYSGTVSGALEGALLGVPSLAVSLEHPRESGAGPCDFAHAANAASRVAERILVHGLPPRVFLNINVPCGVPKGYRTTVQARRNHVTQVNEFRDPRGRPFYWIGEARDAWDADAHSDHQAVRDGYVSVMPMQPDMTAYDALRRVEAMNLSSGKEELAQGREADVE
jgi:5'-nucleotidase